MNVVQAAYAYKENIPEVTVRAWAEFLNGGLVEEPLNLPFCTAELIDEAGATVASAVGSVDPADSFHTIIHLDPAPLVAGQNYLLVVSLRDQSATVSGPRTFGVPVN